MIGDAVAGCFDDVELTALLDGGVTDAVRDGMLSHIGSCATCAEAFQRLSAGWSLEHLADPQRKQAGVDTLALREHLAASPPPDTATGGGAAGMAAIPRAVPVIPGIVDLEVIGRGGMGVVYRGRDTRLDRLVAVKVLSAWAPLSNSARERAEREALMLGRLHHPNIVAIHAAGEVGGTPYLVMEWVAGSSLQKRLAGEGLEPREAARIARDLARAIEQVHALGIIHRDIKPDNVLMATQAGGSMTPKLADFGLARPQEGMRELTQAEAVLGTPAYMAPEQTGLDPSLGEVGPPADIHGLGGVLFAMLTGHAPYEASTPLASMQCVLRGDVTEPARASHVPLDLRTIMWKCLEPIPGRRYRSAGELADDLTRFLEGLPVLARPISAAERVTKWARRRPLVAAALVAATALGIALIAGTAYHVTRLEQANAEITRSRDRAEDSLALAERSLERLTGESIRGMLFRGRALDEGDRTYLRQVRDEFAAWPLGTEPRRALAFRSDGLRRVAELFARVGQFEDMLACLDKERESLDELDRLAPGDAEAARRRLDLMYQERHALARLGRNHDVIASARRTLAILEAPTGDLHVQPSAIAETRIQLGTHLAKVGAVEEARPYVVEGLAGLRQARAAARHERQVSRTFVMSLYNAALTAKNAGWHDLHRQWLEELVTVGEDSLQRFPDDREVLARGISLGLRCLASLADEEGRRAEALSIAARWRAFCHDQVPDGDGVTPMHREAADADMTTISMLRQAGDNDAAIALLDEAAPFIERLYAAEPALYDNAILQARALRHRGQLLVDAGDPAGAMPCFADQIAVLESWKNSEPQAGLVKALLDEAQGFLAQLADRTASTPAVAAPE